jgi:hypothetical protein
MADSAARGNFRHGIRAAIRGLWSGALSFEQAWRAMNDTLYYGITQAWHEGLAQLGIKPADMSPTEQIGLQQYILDQLSYLDGFLNDVDAGSKANGGKLTPQLARADLWEQRYNEAREKAKSMASVNPPLKWEYGDTVEHCGDCSRVEGRVYRKETWDRYGWVPQSPQLECGGWQCDCRRVPTTEPCTPGRPPSIRGG